MTPTDNSTGGLKTSRWHGLPTDAADSFETVIERFSRCRILVVGDLMLDRYVYGDVARISPEAPAPVLLSARRDEMLGGAGNVARNIAAMGAACDLVAVVGDDEPAHAIRRMLGENALVDAFLLVRPDGLTTVKTRFVANLHNTHLLRVDTEDCRAIDEALETALIAHVVSRLTAVDAIVLSDYGKGVLTQRVLAAIVAAARASDKPVIVDPKGHDFLRYGRATVLTPNVGELEQAIGRTVANEEAAIVAAGRTLIDMVGCDALLVTRGEKGTTILDRHGAATSFRASAPKVVDVSGAGDTVVAGFALGLVAGGGLVNAARLANAAAGLVVAKPGTAHVSAFELRNIFLSRPRFEFDAKRLGSAAEAEARVRDWQRRGLVVGFTNGCFDLVHPGHIALLVGARGLCDRLIVGLNDDASVKRLKGESRPIQDETSRATVLAALVMVDGVVLFTENTPLGLIERLTPDVLIKGADYTLDQVVGRDVVKAYGGRVALVDLLPDTSTTRIVDAIRT